MQSTHRAAFGLFGLSLLLVCAGGCGQNEGGRCQVNSDCASGLVCDMGTTGNGRCVGTLSTVTDAAADLPATTGSDLAPAADVPTVGSEAGPETSVIDGAQGDLAESGMGEVDASERDAAELDTGKVDAGEPDTREPDVAESDAFELDAPVTEAGPVDTGSAG